MTRRRWVAKGVVWLTFAWLVVLAGFLLWAKWTHDSTEHQVPKLVAGVDDSMRVALQNDPQLPDKLVLAQKLTAVGAPEAFDVFAIVPTVRGAEPFLFEVDQAGAVVIGYRGTSIANDICVRSVVSPTGSVETSRASCSAW